MRHRWRENARRANTTKSREKRSIMKKGVYRPRELIVEREVDYLKNIVEGCWREMM